MPSVPVPLESTWLLTHAVLPAVRISLQEPALDPSCDRSSRRSLELSPLHQIPVRQQGSRLQSSVKQQSRLRYHVVSACKQACHTHTCFARREGLQDRMTRVRTARSDCVLNKGRKTDRLIYTSRFVRVIYSSCIVLIGPSTVTRRVFLFLKEVFFLQFFFFFLSWGCCF